MKYKHKELLNEFFDFIHQDYPHLKVEDVNDIISAPFRFLKQEMETGNLDSVRFKYLGVFRTYRSRVEKQKEKTQERFDKGYISEKEYKRIMKILNNYNYEK